VSVITAQQVRTRRFIMAHINPEEFEKLWESAKVQPVVRRPQAAAIKADLSLTGILNRYMAMAANHREWGKISQQDYNDLDSAVNALKSVLARINDSALVAEAAAKNAALIEQKMSAKKSGI
jgi:hypothetical protein